MDINVPLEDRMLRHIEATRELAREYALLSEEQQKSVRGKCHPRQGQFSKAMFPLIDTFIGIETTLINKGQA